MEGHSPAFVVSQGSLTSHIQRRERVLHPHLGALGIQRGALHLNQTGAGGRRAALVARAEVYPIKVHERPDGELVALSGDKDHSGLCAAVGGVDIGRLPAVDPKLFTSGREEHEGLVCRGFHHDAVA